MRGGGGWRSDLHVIYPASKIILICSNFIVPIACTPSLIFESLFRHGKTCFFILNQSFGSYHFLGGKQAAVCSSPFPNIVLGYWLTSLMCISSDFGSEV
jgi:hypothetical protein